MKADPVKASTVKLWLPFAPSKRQSVWLPLLGRWSPAPRYPTSGFGGRLWRRSGPWGELAVARSGHRQRPA